MKKLLLVGLFCGLLTAGCVHIPVPTSGAVVPETLVLAEDGNPCMPIVISANAPEPTRYAAEELRQFLTQMTGAPFEVVTDDAASAPHEILVGESRRLRELNILVDYEALGPEGYVLRTRGGKVIITGGAPRGTVYGVYGFLEDHLGCRWFTPTISSIPEARVLAVLPIDEVRRPVLEYREPFVEECFDGAWAVRNRMNSHAARIEPHQGGKMQYCGFVHTFEGLLPPEKYFDAHPEYYSLVKGVRLKERSQLCCTHPDVIALVTEEVRRRMREHPEATVFSVSQNDWYNYCECPACTALAEAEGSQMGPMLALVNAVARAVADEFPDKAVDTLAYQYTRKPPATLRPEPNVIIRLCSIECDFAHPFEERTTRENKTFCDDIEAWAGIAKRLWVWNYNTSYAHYLVPFPNLLVRGPNIRYMIRNNVRGIFEQDVYNTPHGQFSVLSGYLGAKLLWNPNYDVNTAINEFLRGVYGEAATPMRMYIDLMHEAVADPATPMGIWIGPDAPFFSDALFARADALFDVAEKAVAEAPEQLEQVRIARLPVDYCILERTRALSDKAFICDHDRLTVGPRTSFKKRADRFFETAERNGLRVIREHDGELAKYKEQVYAYIEPRQLTPLEPVVPPTALAPGLTYACYVEQLEALPDFAGLTPVARGAADVISLAPGQGHSAFALDFNGYLRVKRDGIYTFCLRSNDGSRLYIGDKLLIDNDGLHKEKAETEFVALKKGCYPIRVSYFESGGAHALSLHYAGPDIAFQELPAAVLFHAKP